MSGQSKPPEMSTTPEKVAPANGPATSSAESAPTDRPVMRLSEELPLRRGDSPIWKSDGVHPFAALSIVLALAMVCAWFMWYRKRRGAGRRPGTSAASGRAGNWMFWRPWVMPGKPGEFRVLQSTRLGPRSSLHVVEWQGQQLLLGCTEQSITTLDRAQGGLAGREITAASEARP